jgi:predicted nucleic acid-binding protein
LPQVGRGDGRAAQAAGRRIECADAWIAATALLYNAPLVTHNRADYLGVPGLSMISHGDQPR